MTPEFFNGKKDKGAKELANPELKTKLGDELVDNLLTIKNDKSFIDFLSTAGASKEGAGKGNDETRKGYSGFSDSISRMEHRCNIFKKMINTENPQDVFAVEQKELISNLQKTREKIANERDLKNKLEEDLRTETLEKPKNKLKSAINKVNLQLSFHLFNELSLERKLNDLKDISILIIPKLMDEEINKVIEEISKSDSSKEKKKLEKKQKELEELKENKEQIISNIKQMSKLDKNEITAIVGYTSEFYNQINGGLRFDPLGLSNNEKNKELLNWTKVLKSALNKLDSVEGEVYRAEGKSERLNTKVSGNMFADLASTSTASKMSGTIGAYERGTLSVCNIKSGKSIADLSHFGRGEKEVLIPPAIMMKITDRFEKKPEEDWLEVIKNLREEAKNDQEKIQVIAKLEKMVNEEQKFLEAGNKEKKAEERVKPSDLVIFHEELFTEIK